MLEVEYIRGDNEPRLENDCASCGRKGLAPDVGEMMPVCMIIDDDAQGGPNDPEHRFFLCGVR